MIFFLNFFDIFFRSNYYFFHSIFILIFIFNKIDLTKRALSNFFNYFIIINIKIIIIFIDFIYFCPFYLYWLLWVFPLIYYFWRNITIFSSWVRYFFIVRIFTVINTIYFYFFFISFIIDIFIFVIKYYFFIFCFILI